MMAIIAFYEEGAMRRVRIPTDADLERARVAVRQHLQPTRVMPLADGNWLKLELRQPTGAFKVRGAIAALSRLALGTPIVTASTGNHAVAIAWAANRLGHRPTIVVPVTISPRKLELLQEMNANVLQVEGGGDAAEAHALEMAANGSIYVSPYNDPHVIAGQATVLDELLDQIAGDFTLIVPVGGGGLISGSSLRSAKVTDRNISIIGVEAEASMPVSTSVAAGQVVDVEVRETLADGLAGNLEPGSVTVDILRQHRPTFLSVTEAEIGAAMRALYVEHDLVAEGSAATAYAALQRVRVDEQVVAIITGRNIAEDSHQAIVSARS